MMTQSEVQKISRIIFRKGHGGFIDVFDRNDDRYIFSFMPTNFYVHYREDWDQLRLYERTTHELIGVVWLN